MRRDRRLPVTASLRTAALRRWHAVQRMRTVEASRWARRAARAIIRRFGTGPMVRVLLGRRIMRFVVRLNRAGSILLVLLLLGAASRAQDGGQPKPAVPAPQPPGGPAVGTPNGPASAGHGPKMDEPCAVRWAWAKFFKPGTPEA